MNFFERYCSLCKEQGSTPNGVAKKLGIASASVTQWKQGSVPRVETLARIADYFGVTVEYLTGKSEEKKKSALPEENGLDEEQQQQFYDMLERARPFPAELEELQEIVNEELEQYFSGNRPLEETLRILDSRVQLYLDERK